MGTVLRRLSLKFWIGTAGVVLFAVLGWSTHGWWQPRLADLVASTPGSAAVEHAEERANDHGGDADTLHLSPQARSNLGLADEAIAAVRLGEFERTITVPGVVAERPGRTRLEIAAPMTGVITSVAVQEGEFVESGKLLFRMHLTHEDLVRAQAEFLRTLGELAVEQKEVDRLTEVTNQGAVAGKVLLERQYAKEKLEAVLRAHRQSLLLHGLSREQIGRIEETGDLISEVEIAVPLIHEDMSIHDPRVESIRESREETGASAGLDRPSGFADDHARVAEFVVAKLNVHAGESVTAGRSLCVLADYGELYVQGRAFEQDAEYLSRAAENEWGVDAAFESRLGGPEIVRDLPIVYLSSEVEQESRAYPFYVDLPNRVVRRFEREGDRFVTWRYKPGQRVNLLVPVERWTGRIVLPVEAVAEEGAETYVFVQDGDSFERRPVHVQYRGQHEVVIANDGSVFPGERVATTAAHQMQVALKNAAGGAVDPHAGHSH